MGVKVTSHVYDQYRKDIKCTLCIVRPVFFAENMCIDNVVVFLCSMI